MRGQPLGKSNRNGQKKDQYINMPYVTLRSPAWRSLSGAALKVFFELHLRYKGSNNGKVVLSLNDAVDALGIGKTTAQRAFKELEDKGFIVLMKQGNWIHRSANEWRLTHKPMETAKGRTPPTMDWRLYQPPKTKPKKQNCGTHTDPSQFSVVPFQDPKTRRGSA
jgi:hypothetical protein